MLTYQELIKKPSRFIALTSLTGEEFDELIPAYERAWKANVEKRSSETESGRRPQTNSQKFGR